MRMNKRVLRVELRMKLGSRYEEEIENGKSKQKKIYSATDHDKNDEMKTRILKKTKDVRS